MKIAICKCGCTHFYRSYPARGVWTQTIEATERKLVVLDSSTDGLRCYKEPKFMRCTDCGAKVPNPDFE